jgi:hypothetical protein
MDNGATERVGREIDDALDIPFADDVSADIGTIC